MFGPCILLCLLAYWHFPSVILHWLVAYNINILFPHLVGEAEDIRCPHRPPYLHCGVHGAPHVWRCAWQCYMMLLCICQPSMLWKLGCDGIILFLIPPPSFMLPSVGLCCATYLLCCLQQTCLEFHPDFLSSTISWDYCPILLTWHRSRLVHKIFFTFRRLSVFTVSFTIILQALMQIMKRFALYYWLVTCKWFWYRVYNKKVLSSSPSKFLFIFFCIFTSLFDSFHFIIIDVPRPLSNVFWIIIFKRLMRNAYTEPVCLEHLRASK